MKKNITFLGIIFIIIVLSTVSLALNGIQVKYEYNEEINQVTAKIISSGELKDTKPTWQLSEDKKEYTKIFTENMNYTTSVEDINGNITEIELNITDIQTTEIEMSYEYNEETNEVTAIITSTVELEDTKPTWELSEDKKVYTKTFTANTNYSTPVTDKFGNIKDVNIEITQIKVAKIKMEYEYNDVTNTVIAKMVSDIELQDTKPTWELSEDKKVYKKIFTKNTEYPTIVTDKGGNIIYVNLVINQIDHQAPEIQFEYQYNNDQTVVIYLKSNEKMANTKPSWTLSEDCLTYAKTFDAKQNYITTVEDLYGNEVIIPIKLKNKQEIFPQQDGSTITVRYIYTSYDNVIVQIVSSVAMENTKPTWELSEDGYTYTKVFCQNEDYTTIVQDVNGVQKNVRIEINYYLAINMEAGTYGMSGAKVKGEAGGSDLEYFKFGNGENVLFTTFCLHGFEDAWDRDGTVLVDIANAFWNRLVSDYDQDIAKDWTIYICKEVNPDGRRLGDTKDGPGRTTLYSAARNEKGIDLNRCWQTGSEYKRYTNDRNYNGTKGFQAYEAAYLRDFLLSHKSRTGQTVVVDLHGWLDQLIGDEEICKYYEQQYSQKILSYGRYGTQYLITWARENLGAKVALVELPEVADYAEVINRQFSDKYINATLNMLKGM